MPAPPAPRPVQPPPVQPPAVQPAPPEPQEPQPAIAPTAPDRTVQVRVLQEARAAYADGQYEVAARHLRRLIGNGGATPETEEAHWWLAQAQERMGRLAEAAEEYRALLRTAGQAGPGRIDRSAAERRVRELDAILAGPLPDLRGATAVDGASGVPADPAGIERWLDRMKQAGASAIVLDAGTRPSRAPGVRHAEAQTEGVFFQTVLAPVAGDRIGPVVAAAHQRGLAVIAAVTLRRMAWVDPRLGWTDRSYDRATRELRPSDATLDLFHPAFQEYLAALLTDLAATGVDGLLFRADAPLGPTDGLSAFGLRGFEQEFGMPLDVRRAFAPPVAPRPGQPRDKAGAASSGESPEFWRWTGWKARESLAVMERLARAVRARSPRLLVGIELHPEAAVAPAAALLRYGEDLLEARRAGFDFFVIGGEGARAGALAAARVLGERGLVWMVKPVSDDRLANPPVRLAGPAERIGLPPAMGLLYGPEGRAVP